MGGYQDISRYFELLPRKMMVIKIFPGTQDLMEERCCLHSVCAPQDLYSRSDIVLPDRAKLLSKICMYMLCIFISRNIVFSTSGILYFQRQTYFTKSTHKTQYHGPMNPSLTISIVQFQNCKEYFAK